MRAETKEPKRLNTSNPTLSSYLNDIRGYSVPTIKEEEQLFERLKGGDESARDEIVNRNQRFVYSMAKEYAKNEDDVLDYVNEGNVGMLEAMYKFDPSKGFRFLTFASWYIKREMDEYLRHTSKHIRRPNAVKLGNKADRIRDRYFAENGYSPTDEEVFDIINDGYGTRVSYKEDIADVRVDYISDSISDDDYKTMSDFDEEYNQATASTLTYNEIIETDYRKRLIDILLKDIPERNAKILKLTYGIGTERPLSAKEVGEMFDLDESTIYTINSVTMKYLRQKNISFSFV